MRTAYVHTLYVCANIYICMLILIFKSKMTFLIGIFIVFLLYSWSSESLHPRLKKKKKKIYLSNHLFYTCKKHLFSMLQKPSDILNQNK